MLEHAMKIKELKLELLNYLSDFEGQKKLMLNLENIYKLEISQEVNEKGKNVFSNGEMRAAELIIRLDSDDEYTKLNNEYNELTFEKDKRTIELGYQENILKIYLALARMNRSD